jgi:hypothetical protein
MLISFGGVFTLLAIGLWLWALFLLGRPREMAGTPRTGRWQDSGSAQPRPGSQRRRVIAPDDDPDFLRGLNRPKPDDDPRP